MKPFSNPLIARLPLLPRQALSRENSSHHRGGMNQDSGHFLYSDERGEAVLFDACGPGKILSMFSTKIAPDTRIHFYFDGADVPRYSLALRDFYSGTHPDFPAPAVSYETLGYYLGEDSKGGNCLLPVPFAGALKITASGDTDFFYHILWEQYPHGAPVESFPDPQGRAAALDLWSAPDALPEGPAGLPASPAAAALTLAPNKREPFYKVEGSACITALTIEAGCADRLLKDVYLCARWDHLLYDSIHAPLGMFFAVPAETSAFDTPLLSVEKRGENRVRLTSRWPMPYWAGASLSLYNLGDMTIPDIQITVETIEQPYRVEDSGYFNAHHHAGTTEYGKDWTLLQARGWGKYVGSVQMMLGEHYCEGDEHFTLDEACTPQINGTGTEDYYLFCFWPSPRRTTPYNGSTTDVYRRGGGLYENSYRFPSVYYRFHLDGPIAFYESIDARIQHGAMSHIHSQYDSLALCYLQKSPVLTLCDVLDTGSPGARAAHGYQASAAHPRTLEASFIGNEIDVRARLAGFEHPGGEIQFEVSLAPDNRGALLRRRIDQLHGRQKAEVYVDGQFAGAWYDANENPVHRWHDSDFLIPPELCRGKDRVQVLLKVVACGPGPFTAYGYKVYSFTPPAEALFATRQAVLGEWAHIEQ